MTNILHIYTRVSSTIQQEEGTSLENQKKMGIKKAIELGFDYKVWNEGGQSSFNDDLSNRPELVSLLMQIEVGEVKHLFVYNTDRLSRNQQTWAVIRYKLLTHGVTLHNASGQMKLKNPVDDLMLGILSEISQYDNRIRAERSRVGRYQKIQVGNWKGGPPPFGFCLSNKKLEIDPFESEWIRNIYDWYCSGISIKQIQKKLSENGVVTRRGNKQWSTGSIQLILKNPVYVGYFDYTDKLVGETVRIQTPVIIDSQIFDVAQNRRKNNRARKHQTKVTKHFYLLSDVLVCGHCHFHMGGRTYRAGHQYVYYCVKKERIWKTKSGSHKKWQRGNECSMGRSINIDKTNRLVWESIKTTLLEIRRIKRIGNETLDFQNAYFYESGGLTIEEITSIPLNQIDDLAPDLQKKIVNTLINKISVYFDQIKSKHTIEIEYSQHVTSMLEGMCHCETESVVLTEEDDSRSVEVAMAVGSDQFTTVTNTSIPVRNHTSMELEVFAHCGVVSLGGISDLVVDTIYTFLIFPLTISSNKVMNSGIY